MIQEKKRSLRNVSFLVASIALHFILLLFFTFSKPDSSSTDILKRKKIDPSVQFLQFSDLEKLQQKSLVEQDEKEKPSEIKPKDPKFMSKVDKSVEKETRAVNRGDFKNENSKDVTPPKQKQVKSDEPRKPKDEAPASPVETPEMKTFAGGDMAVLNKKTQKTPKKARTLRDLQPNNMAQMSEEAFASVSQTDDYIKDVAAGAQTQLNTREFLYYTYFNRIKKKLRQHWEPMIHEKVRGLVNKGRQVASNTTSTTRLVITLDANGVLTRVQVATTSGLADLDDAAIEALKVAAPFPNPPQDLITDGYVLINWDFILES